jgi:transcriptional regulator with XRE-family HTH domain
MTQEALAHEIEISSNYLSDVERGRRNITIKLLFNLAAGLDVSPNELFRDFLSGPAG